MPLADRSRESNLRRFPILSFRLKSTWSKHNESGVVQRQIGRARDSAETETRLGSKTAFPVCDVASNFQNPVRSASAG